MKQPNIELSQAKGQRSNQGKLLMKKPAFAKAMAGEVGQTGFEPATHVPITSKRRGLENATIIKLNYEKGKLPRTYNIINETVNVIHSREINNETA